MMKVLNLKISHCISCPYRREDIVKGLPDNTFRCYMVYDDAPNFQGKFRLIGNENDCWEIPEWCPLPNKDDKE